MKCFLLQKQDTNETPLKNNSLLTLILIILLLLAMPLYAANNYLFPSDIIDQSEQSQYEVERVNRYASQRKWAYPQVPQTSAPKTFKSKPLYPDSSQYITIDGQPVSAQNQSQQYQPQAQNRQSKYNNIGPASAWFDDSEHYKYGNFKANYPQESQAELQYNSQQASPPAQFSGDFRYPGENLNQFGERNIQQEMKTDFATKTENIKQRKYTRSYPNLLYPSDMEAKRRSNIKKSYSPNSFSSNSFSAKKDYDRQVEQNRQNIQIQYVPVPVYSVPGTLPGTIPGVVTPGKMVPGYSHLSPDYNYSGLYYGLENRGLQNQGLQNYGLQNYGLQNYGLQNRRLLNRRGLNHSGISPFMGSQYNPLTGLGTFPGGSNPFDTFYKTYDSHSQNVSPFASPDAMMPGFSIPDMFSSD